MLIGRAQYHRGLRVPTEEHVIFIAPPRKGKSGALAEIIECYPGPVVVTTTRGDLHALTAASRAAGGPVHVWNPQRLAGVASTMRWDLLGGCEDPATAIRRAVPLSAVASYKGEGEDFWAAAIELWLQTLLHVAALRRGSMDLVHYWALSRTPDSFLAAVGGAGGEAERWGTLIRDLMTSAATKTTDTIRYMTAANLAFMLDPVLREAVTPEPGPGMFSPAGFVRDGGTLYLIAESRDERPSPVAGLFAALVTEIYHEAALAAARMPGGRLDPPMLWALDEVTQTCPLPLPSMLADAGGRGIQIMPVVHGAAQLRARWGRDGARAILDTASVKVFLPGISDPETLELGSTLSDTMAAAERGHDHESRHPVMTEAMISRLPARRDGTGYAFILRDGLTPVIARPPIIWHGSWYKQFTRRHLRRSQPRVLPPVPLPPAPAGPDDLAWDDTAPLPAGLAPAPPPRPGTPGATAPAGPPPAGAAPPVAGRAGMGPGEHDDPAAARRTPGRGDSRRAQAHRPGRPRRAGPAVGRAADRGTGRQLRPGPGAGRQPARGSRHARRPRGRHRDQARRDRRPAGPHVRPDRRPDRRRRRRAGQAAAAYRVHPGPPWWQPRDERCAEAAERLRDWVTEVYRPVFGYVGAMLGDCWDRHPLCLACLDVLHEAWCLLYLPARDPKMVFAQLDWLTRPLLQAAEVMARETSGCRTGGHREPGHPAAPAVPAWLNGRR